MKTVTALSALALAAVLGAGCAATAPKAPVKKAETPPPPPAPALALKVVSLSGPVQARSTDGSVIGLIPGSDMADLLSSEISVLSGRASFRLREITIVVQGPATFVYSAPTASAPAKLAATAPGTHLRLLLGQARLSFDAGSAVTLAGTERATSKIMVAAGKAVVLFPNASARTLKPGDGLAGPAAEGAAPKPKTEPKR
ncbi:MAG TPA: hypothetical protein VNI01_16855 [Elusimicrobiota bacterium]|jgi:hypothetical protein|nr:hypothetical protein [Elusimicrobiota bacterium]